jgi:type I restriction enzyme S subunit
MSSMGFIEKLLDGYEVRWKTLGDLGDFIRGSGIQKSDFTESGAGCIHYGQIHTHYGTWAVKTKSFINPEFAARLRKANTGNLVIATTSEDDAAVAKAVAWLGEEEVAVSTDAYIYRHTIDPKYVSYFFQTELFQSQKKPHITGIKVRRISGDSLAKIKIPIPCPENPKRSLEIQAKIVSILDAFTELTAELTAGLTAELIARKKQYNHCRDQLLSFDENDVVHLPLGQEGVGEFIRGGGLQKKDFTETGVGCIHYGQIYTHYGTYANITKTYVSNEFAKKARKAKTGDLVIATTSENDEDVCKAVAWLGSDDVVVSSDACIYRHNLNPKFVSYFFQSEQFQSQKRQYITGTKVRRVNADNLAKILIPIPSPEEQAHIVAILDKFDALTNSITENLPREIALRQQQYEHYRDLLLSFPEPEEVVV